MQSTLDMGVISFYLEMFAGLSTKSTQGDVVMCAVAPILTDPTQDPSPLAAFRTAESGQLKLIDLDLAIKRLGQPAVSLVADGVTLLWKNVSLSPGQPGKKLKVQLSYAECAPFFGDISRIRIHASCARVLVDIELFDGLTVLKDVCVAQGEWLHGLSGIIQRAWTHEAYFSHLPEAFQERVLLHLRQGRASAELHRQLRLSAVLMMVEDIEDEDLAMWSRIFDLKEALENQALTVSEASDALTAIENRRQLVVSLMALEPRFEGSGDHRVYQHALPEDRNQALRLRIQNALALARLDQELLQLELAIQALGAAKKGS